MKNLKTFILTFCGILVLAACQKELSIETGSTYGGLAVGSLKDTVTGNCLPITVNGVYRGDSTLTDSNYVTVQLNITTPGNYKIISDSVNGFYFKDSGFINSPGLKTIKLKGIGKPVSPTQTTFTIGFGSGFCSFSVDVIAGGGGVAPPSVPISDYFPTSTGSNWTYTLNLSGDTIRFTVDASNTTVSGNSYRNFIATADGSRDTLLYRKGAGLYYELGNIDFLGVLDSVYNAIEFIFLKDNEAVGQTWESAEVGAKANGTTGKAKLKFTILAKNVSQTIAGSVVDSVIKVQREILFQPTGSTNFTNYSTMVVSYAKNRGLLLIEGTLPPPFPPAPYRFEALRYQIK